MNELELWAGFECTINRVGDVFRNQFVDSGHDHRIADLNLLAELGVRTLRYPVAWETVSPQTPDQTEWRWCDGRLGRLRELGIRVIAGLVHHGSGPRYTNLLADDFATGLARHARRVAERYPQIGDWTPVNEPLTTARFSALYGHWYPHHRDERSFWLALLNQIDGTRLAMREVRCVDAGARLVQTEDLGRTYATAALRDQAAFDNVRRWMSWDLLCGRVGPSHPMWQRLCGFGFGDRLRRIADDPCPPDIVGVNHYLTSDRFLDHRIDRYPGRTRGTNGSRIFADIEGIRALQPPPAGLAGVMREAWARYGIPLAVTEVHVGCTREEQMRWTSQAWHLAGVLRADGIDVRAITSWALLGSHGWNTLLTAPGHYEPGAFDVRNGSPRPTALAALLRSLATRDDAPPHAVLAGEGWWARPIRLHHAPVPRPAAAREQSVARRPAGEAGVPPILITGGNGTLGSALGAACRHRDIGHVLTTRETLDLTDPAGIAASLETYRPWVVINAAGWTRIDEAERDPAGCFAANSRGAALLAQLCAERNIPTISFSSAMVFDGTASESYVESDPPAPITVYGRSKVAAERAITELPGAHLIIRTAAFFSPFDAHNFAMRVTTGLGRHLRQRVSDEEVVSPTYLPDLCDAVLDLAIDGERGIWHLTNGVALTWAEFARRLAGSCNLDPGGIEPVARASPGRTAPRPAFSALSSVRGQLLPPLASAIERFAIERHRATASPSADSVAESSRIASR